MDHLNGMFAVALYDSKTKELFLARDHAGIKPLYFFADDRCVVFGSELKSLFASEFVKKKSTKFAIAEYLRLGLFSRRMDAVPKYSKAKTGTILQNFSERN